MFPWYDGSMVEPSVFTSDKNLALQEQTTKELEALGLQMAFMY